MLWEFWKSDGELFPPEIVETQVGLNKKPHAVIFVFDGSTDQVPASEEDALFYRKAIESAASRGYVKPFVVITKIDVVESRLRKKYANSIVDDKQKEFMIAEHIDGIVTRLAQTFNLPREQIDFLENYTADNFERNLKIEYYLLRTFKKVVDEGLRFIETEAKPKWCRIF
jgi:hypothetical protein